MEATTTPGGEGAVSSLNKAMVIGNLGSDPEVRSTSSGTRVANLSLATNRSYTRRHGTEVDDTEWHLVTLWERLAEVAEEYLAIGDGVYVEGRLQTDEWEGDDGVTRRRTKIVGRRLLMLGSPSGRGGSDQGESRPEDREPAGPTREEKRIAGATEGDGGLDEFDEDELLGDDGLPF